MVPVIEGKDVQTDRQTDKQRNRVTLFTYSASEDEQKHRPYIILKPTNPRSSAPGNVSDAKNQGLVRN
jgi:hypothetical protein